MKEIVRKTCETCAFWSENDPRCMCSINQWGGKTVASDNYCGFYYCENLGNLEPCPFCGSESMYCDLDSEGWYLECNGCLAQGPRGKNPVEAEEKWNRRKST